MHASKLVRDLRINAAERPDTPDVIAQRVRLRAIYDQVRVEREARFPEITSDNVNEILQWQTQRIAELRRAEGLQ